MHRRLSLIAISRASSQKPIEPKPTSDYKKIYQICEPEKRKYITNGIITLLHSSLFMYLPKIYTDIGYLL